MEILFWFLVTLRFCLNTSYVIKYIHSIWFIIFLGKNFSFYYFSWIIILGNLKIRKKKLIDESIYIYTEKLLFNKKKENKLIMCNPLFCEDELMTSQGQSLTCKSNKKKKYPLHLPVVLARTWRKKRRYNSYFGLTCDHKSSTML